MISKVQEAARTKRRQARRKQSLATTVTSSEDPLNVSFAETAQISAICIRESLEQQPGTLSPQDYLNRLLDDRDYSVQTWDTLKTGYYNEPSPLQIASYHVHLTKLVQDNELDKLRDVFASGISLNPCNAFGSSLLKTVCRDNKHAILRLMLQNGCSVQVCDDSGRTPLHDALFASKPAFETVTLLLQQDMSLLFLKDSRGMLPFQYIRKEQYSKWIRFLEENKERLWPTQCPLDQVDIPYLMDTGPNTRSLPEPANVLPLEVAHKVASGEISAAQAQLLREMDISCSEEDYECSMSSAFDDDMDGLLQDLMQLQGLES